MPKTGRFKKSIKLPGYPHSPKSVLSLDLDPDGLAQVRV